MVSMWWIKEFFLYVQSVPFSLVKQLISETVLVALIKTTNPIGMQKREKEPPFSIRK